MSFALAAIYVLSSLLALIGVRLVVAYARAAY